MGLRNQIGIERNESIALFILSPMQRHGLSRQREKQFIEMLLADSRKLRVGVYIYIVRVAFGEHN